MKAIYLTQDFDPKHPTKGAICLGYDEVEGFKLFVSGRSISIPANVPAPITSRIVAIESSASVKPSPIPTPSSADLKTVFLPANISALPRMMQLTTISGRKTPSDLSRAGTNALTII